MNTDDPTASLPPLGRDIAFWGMLSTQFLGAFNDNLFKQLVLLIAAGTVAAGDMQGIATVVFSAPFVLFSGFAGFLSDRYSKRRIVVLSKVAEIVVMSLGVTVFFVTSQVEGAADSRLTLLMGVLLLMGLQSTFFGPAKYGILPEMFRGRDLPQANGLIQMTTFLAIIFGAALAGFLKDWYETALWVGTVYCVAVAVVGTLTSLLLRRTAVAQPGLEFDRWSMLVTKDVWLMIFRDRPLLNALLVSSVFWFLGGMTQQGANYLGKNYLGWSDGRTSMLVATIGLGICLGCVVAAGRSKHRLDFRITLAGTWGLVVAFVWLWWLGLGAAAPEAPLVPVAEPLSQLLLPRMPHEWSARAAMFATGVAAGLFVVPLQVFLQTRPPREMKGRMIGAMNLVNWVGIVLSGFAYFALTALFRVLDWPFPTLFLVLALCLLPIGLFYRPQSQTL